MAQSIDERANQLYWSSDQSVNSVAEELGLSKGRLYEVVRPIRAGRLCPDCGSDLVFENRTARDDDEAACPMCDGTQAPLPPSGTSRRSTSAAESNGSDSGSAPRTVRTGSGSAESAGSTPADMGGVVAGLIVGAAVGIVLGRFFGR